MSLAEGVSVKRRSKEVPVSGKKQTKGGQESEKVKSPTKVEAGKVEEDEDYGDEDKRKESRKSSRQKKEKEEDSGSEAKKGEEEGNKKMGEESGGTEVQTKKADEGEEDADSTTPIKEDEEAD